MDGKREDEGRGATVVGSQRRQHLLTEVWSVGKVMSMNGQAPAHVLRSLSIRTLTLAAVLLSLFVVPGSLTATPVRVLRAKAPVGGEYIVRFKKSVPAAAAARVIAAHRGTVIAHFADINAFWVSGAASDVEGLTLKVEVEALEENAKVSSAGGAQTWLQPARVSGSSASLWGLDRIDQSSPSSPIVDDSYTWCTDGAGVRVYIVDTGVLPTHPEFGNRVDSLPELTSALNGSGMGLGPQCWASGLFYSFSAAASHGTAVASVAAGNELGVAKLATIVDARASNCYGEATTARLTYVLDWINRFDPRRGSKSVINISSSTQYIFGDPNYSALNAQIGVTVDTYNIPVVVAAGNSNDNAYWYSPGNALRAITVGGLAKNSSNRWGHSNWGYTVSFYAPAQYVEAASTEPTGGTYRYRSDLSDCATYPADTCTSGTSFAAPHMAGVIARYLQSHPGASRDSIVAALQNASATYSGARTAEPGGATVPVLVYNDCF